MQQKRFLALALAFSALIVPACSGSDEGGEDCAALFELLDEFRAQLRKDAATRMDGSFSRRL